MTGLISQDIVNQSTHEPEGFTRASIFSQNTLNTTQGRKVLSRMNHRKEGLSINTLAQGVPFHFNLQSTTRILAGPTIALLDRSDRLDGDIVKQFEPVHTGSTEPGVTQRDEDARLELVFDLALSMDAFSVEPFRSTTTEDGKTGELEGVEEATNMMSTTTISIKEPSSIKYGFFQPLSKEKRKRKKRRRSQKVESDAESIDDTAQPMGVKLLLTEWTVGDDPDNYVFVDPYGQGANREQLDTQSTTFPIQSQRSQAPPTIANSQKPSGSQSQLRSNPAASPFLGGRDQERLVSSQGAMTGQFGAIAESQDQKFLSTQPTAGPFGNRNALASKHKPKKRVGGF